MTRFAKWLGILAVVALQFGCPETGPERGDRSPTADSGFLNDAAVSSIDVGVDDASMVSSLALRIERHDAGLFGGSEPAPLVEVPLEYDATSQEWTAQVDWPAGLTTVNLTADDEEVASASAGEQLFPVPGAVGQGSVFNPAPRSVLVVASGAGDSMELRAEPLGDELAVRQDSPEPLVHGGPWFDARLFELGGADPGASVVALLDAIRKQGGPIHTPHGVLFMTAARDDETPPQIRGSWNDWAADPAAELRRIGPSLWARYIEVPQGRQEYKVVFGNGETWRTDIANPHVAWDGVPTGTVGDFNSVLDPAQQDAGRLVWLRAVRSDELGNERDVFVHLPRGYDETTSSFPALYAHDGNESIVRGEFDAVADAVNASDPSTATITVFVALPTQDVRLAEYTMGTEGALGDAYVNFVADTLVPLVDSTFRTRTDRASRGLVGASLGGLISFWGAMRRPDTFGYAAGMSSSFFWGDGFVPSQLQGLGCQDVRYYLDSGSPNDNYDVTLQMRDQLDSMGCDNTYVLEEGGQHDWFYWNRRFGGVLRHFAEMNGG